MTDIQNSNLPRCLSLKKVALSASKRSIETNSLYSDGKTGYLTDFWSKGYMQRQEQTYWCWIAVAASIGSYYAQKPNYYRQAPIYEKAKNITPPGACVAPYLHFPNNDKCNQEGMPDRSLAMIGAFEKAIKGKGYVPFIITELLNNRPLVVAVFFSHEIASLGDTKGHAVVISAVFNEKPFHSVWEVCNPWDKTRTLENFKTFPLYYYGDPTAKWEQTCFTKKPI
ncbi:hypothetical protein [Xenorhabdus bovienii]|uniref:Peptidase C39-like domain-containing protein n=1 Tax=Xenorhabdus bovienii str. feltiae Moldova TaxID=1398200 RepID=A0A077NVP4_XENBV|nr:hypothetical protein [Xenorhabdus bovienii]CDH01661.1 hypothetical protein XBFM1_2270004 [Xenorhabdus bovienii str. feltiae Moldova]